jgi:hypothetical protein
MYLMITCKKCVLITIKIPASGCDKDSMNALKVTFNAVMDHTTNMEKLWIVNLCLSSMTRKDD